MGEAVSEDTAVSERKAKKRRWTVMRFRKHDPSHNLIAAATHFIRANGGRAVVIGGIEVQAGSLAYNFKLAVGFTGKPPVAKDKR